MRSTAAITFLLLFICFNSFSQGYESIFGKESTRWWIMHYFTSALTDDYTFQDDKIIDGKHFKYDKGFYLRESEDNSKLYLIPPGLTEEMLLMDLELEKGDTFRIEGQYIQSDIAVVDTVYFIDGKKIIELNYYLDCWWNESFCPEDNTELKLRFREGIGSNLFNIQYEWFLNCIEKDMVKTYMSYVIKEFQMINTGEDSCSFEILTSIDHIKNEFFVYVYPNPITDEGELIFKNPDSREFKLELYNISGILYYSAITRGDRFKLSSDEFIPGIYFSRLYTTRTNVHTGKVIFIED